MAYSDKKKNCIRCGFGSKEVTKTVTKPPNAGKGRPKGSPNKVTKELKDMILAALDGAGGIDYLRDRAMDSPNAFLSLVGKVLPLQVTGEGGGPLTVEILRFGASPATE